MKGIHDSSKIRKGGAEEKESWKHGYQMCESEQLTATDHSLSFSRVVIRSDQLSSCESFFPSC